MTAELAALRRALHAEELVPNFVRWASARKLRARPADVVSMRDWARLVVDDPEVQKMIRRVLNSALEQWTEHSFDSRIEHHHALLFHRLSLRLEGERHFVHARRLASWSRESWARVLGDPDYVPDLVASVSPEGNFEIEMLFTSVFEERIAELDGLLVEALGSLSNPREVDEELASYARGVLRDWADSDFPFSGPTEVARLALVRNARRPIDELGKQLDSVNFAEASRQELVRPFEWIRAVYEIIGYTPQASAEIVTQTVDFLWTLRRLDLDVEATVEAIVGRTTTFNENLIEALSDAEMFGHNARCADFLVFQGERVADRDRRVEIFSRGLEICPGHRNSAKLLSHEYLWDVESALLKIESISSLTAGLGPIHSRAERLLDEADEALGRVEDVFAFNESIPDKREELDRHRFRLGIPRSKDA